MADTWKPHCEEHGCSTWSSPVYAMSCGCYQPTMPPPGFTEEQLARYIGERVTEILSGRGWVPVGDRLPDDCKEVLLFIVESGSDPEMVTGAISLGEWKFDGLEGPGSWVVTHWMPLPKGPE